MTTAAPQNSAILIVEDDASIAAGLALNLRVEGYTVEIAGDGAAGLARARQLKPQLIVLDLALPRKNGLELLQELRDAGDRTPVIVLSARDTEADIVAALKLGADDYVPKPFSLAELLARISAVLRRVGRAAPAADDETIAFGEVEIRVPTRAVFRAGREVKLTHLEFNLLVYLARHPGRVFSRENLLREVWDVQQGSVRTVDNFVAQLRAKIEADPEHPRHLVTVRGSGYRLDR